MCNVHIANWKGGCFRTCLRRAHWRVEARAPILAKEGRTPSFESHTLSSFRRRVVNGRIGGLCVGKGSGLGSVLPSGLFMLNTVYFIVFKLLMTCMFPNPPTYSILFYSGGVGETNVMFVPWAVEI